MQKKYFKIFILIAISFLFSFLPLEILADNYEYDVGVNAGSINFSTNQFYAGDSLRIYGTINNYGEKDLTGYVAFYQGPSLISEPQLISLKSGGSPEEVWVDWVAVEGTYNIALRILQPSPRDDNPSNNQTISSMLTVTRRPEPTPPPEEPVAPSNSNPSPATGSTGNNSNSAPATNNQNSNNNNTNNQSAKTNTPSAKNVNRNVSAALPNIFVTSEASAQDITNQNVNNANDNNNANVEPPQGLPAASVTAIVPPNPYNTKPIKKNAKPMDPYLKVLLISGGVALFFMIIAYLLWRRERRKQQADESPMDL